MRKRSFVLVVFMCLLLSSLFSYSLFEAIVDTTFSGIEIAGDMNKMRKGFQAPFGGTSIGRLKKGLAQENLGQYSFNERLELYDTVKVSVGWPTAKNALLGFGLGSKLQHHQLGYVIGQVGDWSAVSLAIFGATMYFIEAIPEMFLTQGGVQGVQENHEISTLFFIAGGATLAASRLIQVIIPLVYGPTYNKTLRDGLYLSDDLQDTFSLDVGLLPQYASSPQWYIAATIRF
jgi:hypothetical protein